MTTIVLDTEEKAWATLRSLLSGELETDNLHLDFSAASWATMSVDYKGDRFNKSLTPSAMRGIVELQNGFYRSVALIISGEASVKLLTDDQKSKLEFIFFIGHGSTTSEADGAGALNEAYTWAAKKMSGTQLFVLSLVLGLVWLGKDPYIKTIDAQTDQARINASQASATVDARRDELRAQESARRDEMLAQTLAQNRDLLNTAMKQFDDAKKIREENSKSIDALLKNTSDAEYVVLQGRVITKDEIDQHNKRTRRKSDGISLDAQFKVLAIESMENRTFRARVRKYRTTEEFVVDINDIMIISKYMKHIQKALVSEKWVRLQIDARKKGNEYYEARLTRAYPVAP